MSEYKTLWIAITIFAFSLIAFEIGHADRINRLQRQISLLQRQEETRSFILEYQSEALITALRAQTILFHIVYKHEHPFGKCPQCPPPTEKQVES